jgi:hypothetical protein
VNHFGVAIGAIAVTVIGGAVVLDHVWTSDKPATELKVSEAPAQQPAESADTSPSLAAATPQPESSTASTTAAPSAVVADEPPAAKLTPAPKKVASATKAPREAKTVIASADVPQRPIQDLAPLPAPPAVESAPPSTPAPSTTNVPSAPPAVEPSTSMATEPAPKKDAPVEEKKPD